MPLLTCTDCGGQVSDQADACPHCGRPVAASLEQQAKPVVQARRGSEGLFLRSMNCACAVIFGVVGLILLLVVLAVCSGGGRGT